MDQGLRAFVLVVVAVTVGCSDEVAGICPADLRVRYAPSDTILVIGQSFAPKVEYLGCAGTRVLQTRIVYRTSNPTVLAVDSLTGRAAARAPGQAILTADAPAYHFPVHIGVEVREAALANESP